MNYYDDYYTEIVYYEYERPSILMNSNGSIVAKPNKWENICKQYILFKLWKNTLNELREFYKRDFQIMPWLICEKSTEYESIAYLSYQKKAELIKLENGIKLNLQTVYYHESSYSNSLITQKENKIKLSGIYHYDERYLHENGEKIVRLVNNRWCK